MSKDSNHMKQDIGRVVDTRTKYRANVEKVKSTVRSTIDTLVPGSLGYFDVLLVWQTPEVTEDESRSCRVMLVKSEQQSEPLSLPNRRAGLCLLSTVLISADAVVVPMLSGQVHARTDREIESAVLAAIKEQSLGNLATVKSIISRHQSEIREKSALDFDAMKFRSALKVAASAGTARQGMYRAALHAITAIEVELGPKKVGKLKANYVTTTTYRDHLVLTLSWEPVESVDDMFYICAMPTDTKSCATKSYPTDVIEIQNAGNVIKVKNQNDCMNVLETAINSDPFMVWLAQHTLGTA